MKVLKFCPSCDSVYFTADKECGFCPPTEDGNDLETVPPPKANERTYTAAQVSLAVSWERQQILKELMDCDFTEGSGLTDEDSNHVLAIIAQVISERK